MAVALLTDFGTRDPYVASMKGVIASLCDATVVDLTHEIAPFDVFGAAWFLRSVVHYWPAGTIFVCVIDPGVGTARRILAMAKDGRLFLAPDNGLLSFIGGDTWSVENETLFLPGGSNTFHGRDRFAPVAAALARNLTPDLVGPKVDDIIRLDYDEPEYGEERVLGTIVSVDRFGNLITDIERKKVPFEPFEMGAGSVWLDRMQRTYEEDHAGAGAATPFMIVGSLGTIEISLSNASAADHLGLRRLDRVEVWPAGSGASLHL